MLYFDLSQNWSPKHIRTVRIFICLLLMLNFVVRLMGEFSSDDSVKVIFAQVWLHSWTENHLCWVHWFFRRLFFFLQSNSGFDLFSINPTSNCLREFSLSSRSKHIASSCFMVISWLWGVIVFEKLCRFNSHCKRPIKKMAFEDDFIVLYPNLTHWHKLIC